MSWTTPAVPEHIRNLAPYLPGKPIEETQREFGLKKVVKLASNENPLGPSPKAVAAAARALKEAHRYPDSSAYRLKEALARHLGLASKDWVTVGSGSNELIDLLVRAYCGPGDQIVTGKAAFIAYKIAAQAQGVTTLEAPLDSRPGREMRFDLDAMAELVRASPRARLVFLPNPNNPTGTHLDAKAMRAFLREIAQVRGGSTLVALDYAYWEYVAAADLPDAMELRKEFQNVVVLRTFSKIYGLAGLRVGYAVGEPSVLAPLEKVRLPFNVGSAAMAAAEAALGDKAFVARARKLNREGMDYWGAELERLGVPYLPSQGNFLLVNARRGFGVPGVEVFQRCLRKGVIFRPVANYGLDDWLRVGVGTAAENRFAARILAQEMKGLPAREPKGRA